jgi:predicted enzyme related to lactoylglutathione lyase
MNQKMTRIDTIIAVKNVEASAKWYHQVFGFKNAHGGKDFAVLKSEDDEIVLCLHKWGEHHHPSLTDQRIPSGNGLLLYFRTDNMETIRKNVDNVGSIVEEEIHRNENSLRNEFSLRDLDGYFLIVTEFHKYEG